MSGSILRSREAQSLFEVLVALSIGVILLLGSVTIIAPSLRESLQTNQVETETQLAAGLLDNAKTWSEGGWNSVLALATSSAHQYYLNTSASPYAAATGTQTVSVGTASATQYFYLSDVYRDSSGNVTTTITGNTYDPSTKQITVLARVVGLHSPTTTLVAYLTRNIANIFEQVNWSGGPGQNGPATTTNSKFASSTGIAYSVPGAISATASTGTLDSTTFDTGVASGSQFNSLLWMGTQSSTSTVQFQLAVSNASSGPWNFMGSDGTVNTYYTPGGPGSSVSLSDGAFSGFRYFRYRVAITKSGTSSIVNDVIINWSP